MMENLPISQPEVQSAGRSDNSFIHFLENRFPMLIFRQKRIILDFNRPSSIQRAADDLAEGKVIGAEMAGAKGLVADGTNEDALEKIFFLKLRDKKHTLIIGGGRATRDRLIDKSRWSPKLQGLDPRNYDIPHFLECPIKPLSDWIGRNSDDLGRTGSIFWANFYAPLGRLEDALLERKPDSFLAGSSANLTGRSSIETTKEVFSTFTQGKHRVAHILHDPLFERYKPFHGTNTMLGYRNGRVVSLREGSITLTSFMPVYGKLLLIPEGWTEKSQAVYVDVDLVRATGSYFYVGSKNGN